MYKQDTVKSPNKDCLGQPLLSFVRGSSSLGGSNCIVIIGKKYFVVSSHVLRIENLFLSCSVHYQRFYGNSYVRINTYAICTYVGMYVRVHIIQPHWISCVYYMYVIHMSIQGQEWPAIQ